MISIQATKGQLIGAAIAIVIGIAAIFASFSYVDSVYAAAAAHSVAQAR